MAEDIKPKKVPKLNSLLAQKDTEYKYVEPDEWYVAEFLNAEMNAGKFGPYIKFTFQLCNGNFEDGTSAKGHKVTAIQDAVLSPSKKLWKWASVMLGRDLKVDENFDMTTFFGEKYRILIKDKQQKKGEEGGKRYQQIDSIKKREKKVD
jgi:hypothetical protein